MKTRIALKAVISISVVLWKLPQPDQEDAAGCGTVTVK